MRLNLYGGTYAIILKCILSVLIQKSATTSYIGAIVSKRLWQGGLMKLSEITTSIADILSEYDKTRPQLKERFKPGIGPIGEPQLIKTISLALNTQGFQSKTLRTPDLDINGKTAIEFKIVRPFGDNGKQAENWSVNLLHPYPGNESLLGDAIKMTELTNYAQKILFMIGYEHNPPKISLNPLLQSFELVIREVLKINISQRCEEIRDGLVHPEHQVLRCISWELI